MTWKEKRDQKGPFFDDHYGVMGELFSIHRNPIRRWLCVDGFQACRKRQAGDKNARFDLVISGRESFGITLMYPSC